MKKVCISILFCITVILNQNAFAQTSSMTTVKRSFATVMFAGLGGAVLGLSTLSFYGNPQEHIGNIWTGATLGVLGGVGYVFLSANQRYYSNESYSLIDKKTITPIASQVTVPIFLAEF